MKLADLRLSYTQGGLLETDIDPDPLKQFALWFDQALTAELPEPNAMVLATVDPSGTPRARIVLLKGLDESGFVFYTNYESRKGVELEAHPRASLLFYWAELERQVRISGSVTKLSTQDSEAYFQSRPKGHQLGAWASRQSTVISGREELEQALLQAAERFSQMAIPLPPYWGGYRLYPEIMEFWQGRANRLHDRLEYRRDGEQWSIQRLSP